MDYPSALPANRGRHPLIWALVLGLRETASSFFLMEATADSGALVDQRPIKIDEDDDAPKLYDKVLAVIPQQVIAIIDRANVGQLDGLPQDHMKANIWRKRVPADGCIDWRMPAQGVHRLVNALTRPYPGADFKYEGRHIKVWKSAVVLGSLPNQEPGKVLSVVGRQVTVKCGVDALCLVEHELLTLPKEGGYL